MTQRQYRTALYAIAFVIALIPLVGNVRKAMADCRKRGGEPVVGLNRIACAQRAAVGSAGWKMSKIGSLPPRVVQEDGITRITMPIVHEDGFTVAVYWDEDGGGYWIAEVGKIGHTAIGTHPESRTGALLDLVCALAATMGALDEIAKQDAAIVAAAKTLVANMHGTDDVPGFRAADLSVLAKVVRSQPPTRPTR